MRPCASTNVFCFSPVDSSPCILQIARRYRRFSSGLSCVLIGPRRRSPLVVVTTPPRHSSALAFLLLPMPSANSFSLLRLISFLLIASVKLLVRRFALPFSPSHWKSSFHHFAFLSPRRIGKVRFVTSHSLSPRRISTVHSILRFASLLLHSVHRVTLPLSSSPLSSSLSLSLALLPFCLPLSHRPQDAILSVNRPIDAKQLSLRRFLIQLLEFPQVLITSRLNIPDHHLGPLDIHPR